MKERITALKNVVLMSAATYAELAFGLLLGVVIARSLGNTEFGHYAFSVWVCGVLITLSNNALTMTSIRFIAEARGNNNMRAAAALEAQLSRLQIYSTTIVLALFAIFAYIYHSDDGTDLSGLMLPLMAIGTWSRAGYMMMASIAKGYERFEVESGSLVLSAAANLVLVAIVAVIGGTLTSFFAIYAVCGLIQNLSARIITRRLGIKPALETLSSPVEPRLKRYLMQSSGLVLLGLMGDRSIEVVLLKVSAGPEAVGYFAIAGALTKGATYMLAGALSSVLLPGMSRAYGEGGKSSVVKILRESIRFYWFIGLIVSGLGVIAAPGMVRALYGSQFEGAIPAVTINLVIAGLLLFSAALNAFLTSNDRQGDRIKAAIFTLIFNFIVGVMLVPRFGLAGALGSLVLTRIAAFLFVWRFAGLSTAETIPLVAMLRLLASAGIGCAAAEGVGSLLHGPFGFVAMGLLYIAIMLASSVLLGAWTTEDFALLARICMRLGRVGEALATKLHVLGARYAVPPEYESIVSVKYRVACNLGNATGISRCAGFLRSSCVRDLRVLAYHRVLKDFDDRQFTFDIELVSARQQDFEWQMSLLASRFHPVTCREVSEAFSGGRQLPKHAVMVTFDDGFLDNYDVAYPILKRYQIPGVFFLSTDYIGSERPYWFDWLVHSFLVVPRLHFDIDGHRIRIDADFTLAQRRLEARRLLSAIKRAPESFRRRVLQEFESKLGEPRPEAIRSGSIGMTWDHVREMSRGGMEFGSHTVSHPVLSRIENSTQLNFELQESRTIIERHIERPVIAMAYPVGGRGATNSSVISAVAEAGYEIAFTYELGTNYARASERFRLRRLAVERYMSRDMFLSALEVPELFAR